MAQSKTLHMCKCGGDQFITLQRYTVIGTLAQRGLQTEGPADNPLTIRCANTECNTTYVFNFHKNSWAEAE